MLILPSIDLREGRCVRLLNGDFDREIAYDADPVETARSFEEQGAKWIHVVDLDGAKKGSQENFPILERIFSAVGCGVEVGGGIRNLQTARQLIEAGAGRVVLGTALVKDPDASAEVFAALGDLAVAGIDARNGQVATEGWLDQSSVRALDLAKAMIGRGARRLIVTDIARDGALQGPNLELFAEFCREAGVPVIASGGIGTLTDIEALAALQPGPEGAITGRALYEGRFSVREAILATGVPSA